MLVYLHQANTLNHLWTNNCTCSQWCQIKYCKSLVSPGFCIHHVAFHALWLEDCLLQIFFPYLNSLNLTFKFTTLIIFHGIHFLEFTGTYSYLKQGSSLVGVHKETEAMQPCASHWFLPVNNVVPQQLFVSVAAH